MTAGGTGATNAADALTNLGGVGQSNFLSAYSIGDSYTTLRDISAVDGVWLRRNGALYDSATYPVLGALLPSLPDGITWTTSTVFSGGLGYGLINTPSGYMLANDDGTDTKIYTSTDAVSWGVVATIPSFRSRSLVYGSGIYVAGNALAGSVSVSADGVTWSSPISVNTMTVVNAVSYGFGLFVAVGDAGKISTSPDGVTWTPRTSGVATLMYNVKLVNNLLIAVGASGAATSSPDGINWTSRTTGVAGIIYDVSYGVGQYVFVAGGGVIRTTPNLTAFTTRTSGTSQDLYAVVYSSAGFVAMGNAGTARISSDGLSWVASATGVSTSFNVIIFNVSSPATYYASGGGFISGLRTLPTQFKVPNDTPTITDSWIKAEDA